MNAPLADSRGHLADLIAACQRCAWHLDATARRIDWPLTPGVLEQRQMDIGLFEPLAALNERFAKLQDLLSTSMRHLCELCGERSDTFLRVLAFCEKAGIVPSMDAWQAARSLRNRAAHDYGIDFASTTAHFNALRDQIPLLTEVTLALGDYAGRALGIEPADRRFVEALRRASQSGS
ncbi:MAG: hypothetical protein EBZ74_08950 [Planctomycetia bacterium]|nr:hypothetical protein [Planctomycetia bacterium]